MASCTVQLEFRDVERLPMQITGHDSIVFTTRQYSRIVQRFNARLLTRWPHPIVDLSFSPTTLDHKNIKLGTLERLLLSRNRLKWISVYVVRDVTMRTHFERHGYLPNRAGEGAFAIFLRPRPNLIIRANAVTDIQARDRERAIEPYPAWLCSPKIREIGIVTPGNPEKHAFSKWLFEQLLQSAS